MQPTRSTGRDRVHFNTGIRPRRVPRRWGVTSHLQPTNPPTYPQPLICVVDARIQAVPHNAADQHRVRLIAHSEHVVLADQAKAIGSGLQTCEEWGPMNDWAEASLPACHQHASPIFQPRLVPTCTLFSACRMSPSAVNTTASRPSGVCATPSSWHTCSRRCSSSLSLSLLYLHSAGLGQAKAVVQNETEHAGPYSAVQREGSVPLLQQLATSSSLSHPQPVSQQTANKAIIQSPPCPAAPDDGAAALYGLDDFGRLVASQREACGGGVDLHGATQCLLRTRSHAVGKRSAARCRAGQRIGRTVAGHSRQVMLSSGS